MSYRISGEGRRGSLAKERETARAALAEAPITDEEVRQVFGNLDHLWDELFPGEQARIMQLLVQGVVVHADRIDVRLRAEGMGSLLAELRPRGQEPKERMTA